MIKEEVRNFEKKFFIFKNFFKRKFFIFFSHFFEVKNRLLPQKKFEADLLRFFFELIKNFEKVVLRTYSMKTKKNVIALLGKDFNKIINFQKKIFFPFFLKF